VDGRPTPKVIDFGVAKAVEFKLTDQSLADTGAIVGTPTYMSPEQADPTAMDIDTRTDIYALGVILYELLAGSPPIDAKQFRRGAFLEMLRMVREVDPPRPSSKVSTSEALPNIAASRGIEPEHLKRTLRGDLDWIVMKALEKDRTRRYETANGFGADILRHLTNEPVLAAPPDRAYRMRKFVRKNRGAMIAVSLVLLALVGGMVGTSLGLLEARRQEGLAVAAQKAEKERAESESNERRRALQAEAEARKKADELELRLDNSNFLLAVAAYDNSDIPGTRVRLDSIQVKNRGWEWHYLRRQSIGGLFTLYGHTGAVTGAAFSPDGTRIVTGSDDRTAKVWDARTGTPLLELAGHKGQVKSVSFSPDGTQVITGSTDQTARVWEAGTGTTRLELKGHTGAVNSVAFSPDGTRIGSGSNDQTTRVWDARTGAPLLELKEFKGAVTALALSPDGTRILSGSTDGTARVWDARTGAPLLELRGHTSSVLSVAFSPDGARIVTGSARIVSGRTDLPTARVWDARTGAPLLELEGQGVVAFSPDGTRIVTGSRDQTARIWDARTGSLMLQLNGFTSEVVSVAFSPDGTRIVTGPGWLAKVWDAQTGTPLLDLKGHKQEVISAAFSPDGTRIVTGSSDQTAKVWDARTGAPMLDLKGHTSMVESVEFGPDGTRIVTGSSQGRAEVWDARTGEESKDEPIPPATRPRQISPDGRRIAHIAGESVELVPLQPDEEELSYRKFFMEPDFRFYRASYDAARAGKDAFLARFYLNLFPPAEQIRIRAEEIVQPLFVRLGFREDVIAALKAKPTSDTVLQAACLELAGTRPLSANECNNAAWALVSAPGQPEATYKRGLRLAQTACRLEPELIPAYFNTLGVAQYRCGHMAEAEATLTRSSQLSGRQEPGDLAFLALARHRLGQFEKARDALARLREVMKDARLAADPECQAFLREAEAIELDRAFPADPFAR
jgi:WD40 repeat protein